MDYKFWILLLLCIVLFYMYHQIEDLKSEVHHLHNKTDNIADLEKYVDKHKKLELTQNLNNAINQILPQSEQNKNSLQVNEITINNKESSHPSIQHSNTDSISESSKYEYSDSDTQYNVNVDDVMEIIEQNHINEIQTDMNNQFKIKEIIDYNDSSEEEFIKSNESINSNNLNNLVNKVNLQLDNNDNDNDNNNDNNDIVDDDTNNEIDNENDNIVDDDTNNDIGGDNTIKLEYTSLMTKTVSELKELAKAYEINLQKEVEGKKKNKLKKELCQELAARH